MFSSRVPGDLKPNRVARAVRRARIDGRSLIDLTTTNPTRVGIEYPRGILVPLSDPAALSYDPNAAGLPDARAAVSADYARRGINVAADRIVLTASTSDAYSVLFKLLCAPSGDAVLVPVPSYPLFEHLTRLDGIGCIPYRLEYHGRWTVDADSIRDAWSSGVRALLAVSPNNPTGSILTVAELRQVAGICADRGVALVLDEVFADYPIGRGTPAAAGPFDCLTFRLGGLSKSAGLPQVKLGWVAVQGPEHLVSDALDRLDLICDTYLSVSTPVQVAAPALLREGATVRDAILERIRTNDATLRTLAASYASVEVLTCEAGWSVVLRVPSTRTEEALVLELLERDDVLMHPGFFFDFPHEAFLVASLLPEPSVFVQGMRRVLERAHA
jgi:aspartate/methionine/tyrosine aminotransferase